MEETQMSSKNLTNGKPESTEEKFDSCQKMLEQLDREGLISLAKPGDPDYEALKNDQSTTIVFTGRKT
jgi:hypothetical protein